MTDSESGVMFDTDSESGVMFDTSRDDTCCNFHA